MSWSAMTAVILRRRHRAEQAARDHLQETRARAPEVEAAAAPLRKADRMNHLAERVERSLKGHS